MIGRNLRWVGLVLCGWTLAHAGKTAEVVQAKSATPLTSVEALEQAIYEDLTHIDLMTAGNSVYVDLEREIQLEQSMRERRIDLRVVSDELNERVIEMKQLQAGIQEPPMAKALQGKLDESETLRKQLEAQMQDQIKLNDNLKLLVTLYESLKAEEAAGLIKHLPPNVALQMMRMMSPRKSSKILSVMEPRLAAELSKRLIQAPAPSAPVATAKGAS